VNCYDRVGYSHDSIDGSEEIADVPICNAILIKPYELLKEGNTT
jgi:hypothetical protein